MEIFVSVLVALSVLYCVYCMWKIQRKPAPAPEPAPNPWEVVVARRCVVNLKTGRAVDGVLIRKDGPLLFLRNAVLLEEGNEPAAIDGEAVIQSEHVDFIQAL
ncbi:hypothetical protein ACIPY3_02590 [Paenarthrobacter sp. NPDC089714]|uniref:hypothetical protein n=1 Tax=Paenarthrobacter sp. NPDC089714 TaxID=3364377 RepID=UPI0038245C23